MELSITNVINISVSTPGVGIGAYNTSNVALFSRELAAGSFGTDGYKIYLDPTEVATDFGSTSETYLDALSIFNQQPNILQGDGYLVIMPYANPTTVVAEQLISFSLVPTAGNYKLSYAGNPTANIAWDDNAAAVESALQLVALLGTVTVAGDTTAGFTVTFTGIAGAADLLTVSDNSLDDVAGLNVDVAVTTTVIGSVAGTEKLGAAITRTLSLVQYFGIFTSEITTEADMLLAAAVVQSELKMLFVVSRTEADIAVGGMLDLLRSNGYTRTRGLYYETTTDSLALREMASYIGRALSTNFKGSNTTQTMHLKDLTGVVADPSMDQTTLDKALAAGADTYPSIQGVAKTFCSGLNNFFDDVYNLLWFIGDLEVNGFNYLATVSTKIPQTESGTSGLKGAYRKSCEAAITNLFVAPGAWNSATTFGNQADMLANISQRGYYIYSAPVSKQSQVSREAREAPLVQIAIKFAGAVHSSDIIININK